MGWTERQPSAMEIGRGLVPHLSRFGSRKSLGERTQCYPKKDASVGSIIFPFGSMPVHLLMKARRSALMTSACVVHIPCGNFS